MANFIIQLMAQLWKIGEDQKQQPKISNVMFRSEVNVQLPDRACDKVYDFRNGKLYNRDDGTVVYDYDQLEWSKEETEDWDTSKNQANQNHQDKLSDVYTPNAERTMDESWEKLKSSGDDAGIK